MARLVGHVTKRLLACVGALVLAGVLTAPAGGQNSPADDDSGAALSQEGRWLVDGQGRVVILHGVNQVRKLPPYLPSDVGFGADDAAFIAGEGFNTVRTGVIHKGFVGEPGEYRDEYLDDLAETVRTLTDEGLYVLLDYHQDMYNERYQGEGLADWAVMDSAPGDPTNFPNCDQGFPANYISCQFLWEAYDHFFGTGGREVGTTDRGLTFQEEYAESWRHVADRFRGEPLVFGYDIFNEPFPGSELATCANPDGCQGPADQRLTEFSNLVADAIRVADPDTIVFYEPYLTFNFGAETHHGEVDAGPVGMSFHVYCLGEIPGLAASPRTEECEIGEQRAFDGAEAQAEEFDDTLLLTEFGATDAYESIARIADLADRNMVGWQYWAWWNEDPCCERPEEGIINHPSNPPTPEHLDEDKLDVLVRAFPRHVAGTPTAWSWDGDEHRFDLSYTTERVGGGSFPPGTVTEVWVPQRQFPDGYEVVDMDGGRVVSEPDAEALHVAATPGADEVSFAVVRPEDADAGPDRTDDDRRGAGYRADEDTTRDDRSLPATGGGFALLAAVLLAAGAVAAGQPR